MGRSHKVEKSCLSTETQKQGHPSPTSIISSSSYRNQGQSSHLQALLHICAKDHMFGNNGATHKKDLKKIVLLNVSL